MCVFYCSTSVKKARRFGHGQAIIKLMDILRAVVRWVCVALISAALSVWVVVAVAQATVLNRGTVKQWLAQSGVYHTGIGNIVQAQQSGGQGDSLITTDVLQKAFAQTFPASYVQQGAETAVDATYNWLDGTARSITFSVPVQNKSDEFAKNLAAVITPKLAQLPQCSGQVPNDGSVTCIPQGETPQDFATQLTQLSSSGDFLNAPLTNQTVGQSMLASGGSPSLQWLPAAVQMAHTLFWALPVAMVACAALYVLCSPDKLRGVSMVGRVVAINTLILVVGGLVMWYATSSIDLSSTVMASDQQTASTMASIINPLARTILPGVARALVLYSGIACAIGVGLWIGLALWRRRRLHTASGPPIPPPTSQESQLPPPTAAPRVMQ